VAEQPFQITAGGAVLQGAHGGSGPPALLLHGGPGLPDYTEPLAAELAQIFRTLRYTQRGVPPSTVGSTYSVEAHMDDALAVLDAFELDRAWAVGHSWGGHLALHLAVAHPSRLLGIVCIDPLGAFGNVFDEFHDNFHVRMTAELSARVTELGEQSDDPARSIAERERAHVEQHRLLWPYYFADPGRAGPDYLRRYGVECGKQTMASVRAHFERGTLADGLRSFDLPVLFVHGVADPLPSRCSTETAALIPGAHIELIEDCGHFPWLEQPGAVTGAVERLFAG
jgi:pimeloyl-ACP methyl ester carboxylesterase